MWRSSCVPVIQCKKCTRDRTWFTELSDKGMYFLDILIKKGISGYSARCTNVQLYWCMRNCGGNPDRYVQ